MLATHPRAYELGGTNSGGSAAKAFSSGYCHIGRENEIKPKDPDEKNHIDKDNRMQTVYSSKIYPHVSNYLTLLKLCDN